MQKKRAQLTSAPNGRFLESLFLILLLTAAIAAVYVVNDETFVHGLLLEPTADMIPDVVEVEEEEEEGWCLV